MVTWIKSFKTAAKIILCSIIFYIVGVILIIAGLINISSLLYSRLSTATLIEYIPPSISILLGFIILALGILASFLKFNTELIIDEINKAPKIVETYKQQNLPPRNDFNQNIQNNQTNDPRLRQLLGGIGYLVIGLILTSLGYYASTIVGNTTNYYILLGVWSWISIGGVITIYGIYLIIKKYRE